jgi:hypothetical protein
VASSDERCETHYLKEHWEKGQGCQSKHNVAHTDELERKFLISFITNHFFENFDPRIQLNHFDVVQTLCCNTDSGICELHIFLLIFGITA